MAFDFFSIFSYFSITNSQIFQHFYNFNKFLPHKFLHKTISTFNSLKKLKIPQKNFFLSSIPRNSRLQNDLRTFTNNGRARTECGERKFYALLNTNYVINFYFVLFSFLLFPSVQVRVVSMCTVWSLFFILRDIFLNFYGRWDGYFN